MMIHITSPCLFTPESLQLIMLDAGLGLVGVADNLAKPTLSLGLKDLVVV